MSTHLFAAAFVLHIFSSPALSHSRFASNISKVSLAIAFPVFVLSFFMFCFVVCVFLKHCIELFTDLTNPYFGQNTVRTAFCFLRVLYLLSATLYCLAVILLLPATLILLYTLFCFLSTEIHARVVWIPYESSVRKKMAAVHFTTIPCVPNRAISTHRKPHFGEIHPGCTNKIVYARFKVFRPFLCVFMSGFRIFVR